MDILCQVTSVGLVPMYDSDLQQRKRLKEGETVLCTIRKPRNYEFHKKFFALVRIAFDNLPDSLAKAFNVNNEDDMLECFKLDLGLYTLVWHDHKPVIKLGSISFAKMDETEFQTFYNRCIDLILYRYLKGIDRQELLDNIEQFK